MTVEAGKVVESSADGMRLTCFAINTKDAPIAALKLPHCLRTRAEGRIRAARATRLRQPPLHATAGPHLPEPTSWMMRIYPATGAD